MKKRLGFVSNSSSSSFVILDSSSTPTTTIHFTGNEIKVPQTFGGETLFSRECNKFYDFGSKLNWAFLQAYSMDDYQASYGDIIPECNEYIFDDDWWKTHNLSQYHNLVAKVKNVLLSTFKLKDIPIKIYLKDEMVDDYYGTWWNNNFKITEKNCVYASIDHQSSWMQNPQHLIIFDDNNLKTFLFKVNSHIKFDLE